MTLSVGKLIKHIPVRKVGTWSQLSGTREII